jgi:hypothetical protein
MLRFASEGWAMLIVAKSAQGFTTKDEFEVSSQLQIGLLLGEHGPLLEHPLDKKTFAKAGC